MSLAERTLHSLVVSSTLDVIEESGEIPTVSTIARRINYSRTAVQNEIGNHQSLIDYCWAAATRKLIIDSNRPTWPGVFEPDVVRAWLQVRPKLLRFVINHRPCRVPMSLVALVIDRTGAKTKMGGEGNEVIGVSPQLQDWISHMQFRARYYAKYEGFLPQAANDTYRESTRNLLESWGMKSGATMNENDDLSEPTSAFDEVTKGFFTAGHAGDQPSIMIPTPGYFTGRMENILDLVQVEAKRLDDLNTPNGESVVHGPASHLMMAHQYSLNYFMTMAQLSANYYLGMTHASAGAPQAPPIEEPIATEG